MGLFGFGKNKEKLLNQDKELLASNMQLMDQAINICTGGNDEKKELYLKRLNDVKEVLSAFEPFDETGVINVDKKVNEQLKIFVQTIDAASGAITGDVKAALTELQDAVYARNDVE